MPYLVKRLVLGVAVVLQLTVLVFLLMRVAPGDPALLILAGATGEGSFTEEELQKLRRELGTDRPIYVQYGSWLWGLLRVDLGVSLFYRTQIVKEIAPRIPATIELAVLAVFASFVLAVPLGVVSAAKHDSPVDYVTRLFTFTGISIPLFVTGLVLVYALVRFFNWLPPLGYAALWEDPLINLQQMVFPVVALAFFELNFTARVTRSAMLEVFREDYITTARAKGLRERRIVFLHALRNALLPIVTVSGWSLARLLGGTIIIERIFLVPGMGTLLLDAIMARDYTLIQALVLVYATAVVAANLLVDVLYAWLDPRIRYA